MDKGAKSPKPAPRAAKPPTATAGDLKVKVVPFGPDRATVDDLSRRVMKHPSVQRHLKGARHRMLSLELAEPAVAKGSGRRPALPDRHRATIYDYSNNRTIVVEGSLDKPR